MAAVRNPRYAGRKCEPEDDEKRFPKGFKKLARLGTGGFGVVWDATSPEGKSVAVKQIVKGPDSQRSQGVRTAKTEIAMAQHLFPDGAAVPERGGSQFIARLFGSMETRADHWLVFEKCGTTINIWQQQLCPNAR